MYELAGGGGGRLLAGQCLPLLSCSVNSNWCSKLQVQGRRRLQVAGCRCRTAGALVALTGWLTTKIGPGMEVEFACHRAEHLPAASALWGGAQERRRGGW